MSAVTATLPGTFCPEVADRADRLFEGDEAVLADVYQRHGSVVFNVAMRLTGDRSAAEEVTQAPVIRSSEEKLGRNQPCPCGSGKKYKLCHGR